MILQTLVFKALIIILILTILKWLVKYYEKRSRLLELAKQFVPFPGALPLIGNAYKLVGSPEKKLKTIYEAGKLAEEDKPAQFWLGPQLLIGVARPVHLEAVLNNVLGKPYLYNFIKLAGNGLFSCYPVHEWKKNRKIIVPTFNQKTLDSFVTVFQEKAEILTNILEKHVGDKNLNIQKHIESATISSIIETAMGSKTEYSVENQKREFLEWVETYLDYAFQRILKVYLHFDFIYYNTKDGKNGKVLAEKITNYINSIIQQKKKEYFYKINNPSTVNVEIENKRIKPFLELLLELSNKGAHISDQQIFDEVVTFMIGGSDTSAVTMSFVLTMLGMHKDAQEKVYEEVKEVVGLTRPVEYSDIPRLKYTERAIKEAMRLFPIGPNILRQVEEEYTLPTGEILPKGATVCLFILNLHRSEKIYPDPLKYDPDRFLPEEVAKRPAYSFLGFSGGPRNCIGMKYGMMSMVVMISNIVRKFHVHTLYKSIEEIRIQQSVILIPTEGHKVYLTKRNNN